MDSESAKWCSRCSVRIAPYDKRTVYQGVDYHQTCFLKLVREEADEEKARRAFKRARFESTPFAGTR